MNRFNDIISKKSAIELNPIPTGLEYYIEIIQKAFSLTSNTLSFDGWESTEENEHYKILVNTKNEVNTFRLNKEKTDIKNLVIGLNRCLGNAFYVGNERFHDISGKIVKNGIAFISYTQKSILERKALIGKEVEEENNWNNNEGPEKAQLNDKNVNHEKQVEEEQVKSRGSKSKNQLLLDSVEKMLIQDLEPNVKNRMDNYNQVKLFKVAHNPKLFPGDDEGYAKLLAIKKQVPVFNEKDYKCYYSENKYLIKKTLRWLINDDAKTVMNKLNEKTNDPQISFMVLSEAFYEAEKLDKPKPWKIVIYILLLIKLIFLLFRL